MAAKVFKAQNLFVYLMLSSFFVLPAFSNKCFVCKKTIKKLKSTRKTLPDPEVLAQCFGVSYDVKEGSISLCSTCLRTTYFHKKTGKTYFHLVQSETTTPKVGRPCKRRLLFPTQKLSEEPEWKEENSFFGPVKRGGNGDIIVPNELFEEIETSLKRMSKECNLKNEVELVKKKIYQDFVVQRQEPIYDPEKFMEFCKCAGAEHIFHHILSAVTDKRHSSTRIQLNKKRTVTIIYKMCYSLSQLCNIMQVDQALYLYSNNINQEGMDTEHQLGNTCSRKTTNRMMKLLSHDHYNSLQTFFNEATKNEWLLILIIDDFTKIHTNRRPILDKQTDCMNMCTIVIKAYKQLKAIKLPKNIFQIHDPNGLDIQACIHSVTSPQPMALLGNTYASVMPQWIVRAFFSPELERHILEEHNYCDNSEVRHMRTMENLHLVNFVELQLKCKDDFATAYDIALDSGLKQYLKSFAVIQPGDWPCQFYCRQTIYEHLPSPTIRSHEMAPGIQSSWSSDHKYSFPSNCVDLEECHSSVPAIASIIPTMGPLHISLNSREHIFISFRPFFEKVYHYIFPKSKLANLPKPWRINFILETVYGAWTLIRDNTKLVFKNSKDLQYGTLINLLDNYLPLVLSIYTIVFKKNNFHEYRNAMIRIWVMFVCLKRRHYNKSPLVWLSCTLHWSKNYRELYDHWTQWPTIFDEYAVENTHSILRAQTKQSDTAEELTQKAKAIFQSKERQLNFRSIFTPPKQFNFSLQQLQYLKVKCAEFLTNTFTSIHSHPGIASETTKKKTKYVYLPDVFGPVNMKDTILPLGFNTDSKPDGDCRCDLHNCEVECNDEPWKLFEGCGHSFHDICLSEASFCPLCKQFLTIKIQELGSVARKAIVSSKTEKKECQTTGVEHAEESEQTHNTDSVHIPNKIDNLEEIKQKISDLNTRISFLKPPSPPLQQHKVNKECTQTTESIIQKSSTATSQPAPKQHKDNNIIQESSTTPVKSVTSTRNEPPSIKEWILPHAVCQSRIFGAPVPTNSCTIISVLCARAFLTGQLSLPWTANELGNAVKKYRQIITSGNMLYDHLHLPYNQPNLDVQDVLTNITDMNIHISEDLGFFSVDNMIEKFNLLLMKKVKQAGVLIVPAAKSFAILIDDNGQIGLFDSHAHGSNGGVISVSSSKNARDFVAYLGKNETLSGSNFALLSLAPLL